MFGLATSQGHRDGEVGVKENHKEMCRLGITISNSQVYFLRFSF